MADMYLVITLAGVDITDQEEFKKSQQACLDGFVATLKEHGLVCKEASLGMLPHHTMAIGDFLDAVGKHLSLISEAWTEKASTSRTCGGLPQVTASLNHLVGMLAGVCAARASTHVLSESASASALITPGLLPGMQAAMIPASRTLAQTLPLPLLQQVAAQILQEDTSSMSQPEIMARLFPEGDETSEKAN